MKTNRQNDGNDDAILKDSPYFLSENTDVKTALLKDDSETKILRALLERPGFSIRARLALGFLLFFALSVGITITAYIALNHMERKLIFLEVADLFTNEIQQARRYEKNFFLYGSDISNVLEHIDIADQLLDSARSELVSVVGEKNMRTMESHLSKYKKLVIKINTLSIDQESSELPEYKEIAEELRSHGTEMLSFAIDMSRKERDKVNDMIRVAKMAPVVFSIIIFLLMLYETNFLARHIIRRLNRLMEATQRVANGDFTPIMPHRRFRDEFTNLAVAMNSMMSQLMHRHEILVRSHKLRAVGTLTAGVAHELNNPINNIMLTSEMLKEDYSELSDEERLDMVSDLVSQAERARKIVSNLLDFARESEIEPELLDVGQIIRETLALVGNQLKLHNVKPQLDIAHNLSPVHGDKQHLSQVFFNLIMNAIDAMPEGGKLIINVSNSSFEASFLEVRISDTGKGIPEHLIGSIFDPFFTTKPTGKGTGLGLSVSMGIIRKHGGAIRVESKVGEGTSFSILLPISTVPAEIMHEKSQKNGE